MAHSLKLLTRKLYNTPHLIDAQSFEAIVSYLQERNTGEMAISSGDKAPAEKFLNYNPDTQIGLINIEGPLTYKPVTMMGFDCGGASYESITEDFNAMLEKGMKTLVLMADSGGGEAYGMLELGKYMRKRADEQGVKILSYVDGMSASACYGLTCIADEFIMNPSAEAGSVGVVVRLMNDSKALENQGYERTFVYAGGSKVPFAEDGKFREEFLADIQTKVDALYEEFTGYVAEQRNLSIDQVKNTEAKVFMAKDAVALGLADKVMTHEEFFTYLADTSQRENPMITKSKLFSFNKENNEVEMKELMELQAQHSELEAKFQAQGAELVAHVEQIASMSAELEAAKTTLEAAQTELTALAAVKEQMEAEAVAKAEEEKQAKLVAREEKLTALLGEVGGKEVYQAIGELEDAQFAAALKGYELMADRESSSAAFTEVGAEGEGDLEVKPVSFADFMPKKKQK